MIQDNRTTKVFIKKEPATLARLGSNATLDMIYNSFRIGSVIRHNDVLRGLSHEEEEQLLPDIIGTSVKSPEWKKATRDFWCNLSIEVEVTEDNGVGGLVLETGFMYRNEEAAEKGRKEEREELSKFNSHLDKGKEYEMKFTERMKHGQPINVIDFIHYRFILLHPRVANRVDDIYNSPKIQFYIHSQELENKIQHESLEARKEAYGIFMELCNQELKARYVVTLMQRQIDAVARKRKTTFDTGTSMGREIVLEALSMEFPTKLIATYKDNYLVEKAFVEECIKQTFLRRVANTDTIIYGENLQLGYNLGEAISFLRDPKNLSIKQELEAKVQNWTPLEKLSQEDIEKMKTKADKVTTDKVEKETETATTVATKEKSK